MKEAELFEYLKTIIHDLEKAKDQFSPWDCYSKFLHARVELKCRRTHYDTLLIEKIKYDKLIKLGQALYINSTPKGIYTFHLNSLKIAWFERDLPRQTDFKQTDKIKKLVGYIDIQESFINLAPNQNK